MDEMDVIKGISKNLTERKSSAALNNYQVLTNNIEYLNNVFSEVVNEINNITALAEVYSLNSKLKSVFYDRTKYEYFYKDIIPTMISNNYNILKKFKNVTDSDDRSKITIETVYKLSKSFHDYNELVTVARQFIDSLVSSSYQMIIFNAKELNHHVLQSLSSFEKYATKSLKESIFNEEVIDSLNKFNSLSKNKQRGKESNFTKCDYMGFRPKLTYIFDILDLKDIEDNDYKKELENLYSFSSEFTHIGYTSTFFTSSNAENDIMFNDEIGPYLLSSENFNELKYTILNTGIVLLQKLYLPSLKHCIERSFKSDYSKFLSQNLEVLINQINNAIETRYQNYYAFIVSEFKEKGKTYPFECVCGYTNLISPPYRDSDLYCRKCGSGITLVAVESSDGYIVTNEGLARVIGSDAPILSKEEEQQAFERIKNNPEFNIED